MAKEKHQFSSLAETVAIFIMIMLLIWFPFSRFWASFGGIALCILLSQFVLNKDGLNGTGLKPDCFSRCFYEEGERLCGIIGLLVMAGFGVLILTGYSRSFAFGMLVQVPIFLGWAFIQQYVLGYFTSRFNDYYCGSQVINVHLGAAFIFSVVHFPNLFLINICFIGGFASSVIFLRYRNIYFLTLAQFLISAMINHITPDSISHGMRIGPGYFLN